VHNSLFESGQNLCSKCALREHKHLDQDATG